ncbi:hypothetical protein BJV82DRAFT_46034 [Fennellomyces sp. T-0311]|nr:hypothetical protein BJV82DRAFT_46034 [Fennellomyces sp. T-0311]
MLHFFYIVRLAQQGFFSVISSSFPAIEIDAIVYLCDKLVGSSLFAVKDASDQVRQAKHDDVFDLLRKLHTGANEAVGEGYSTTFRQMKDMIRTLVENSLSQAQTNSSSSNWPLAPTNAPPPTTQHCAPPVFLVVPFNSMIDMSALSLYQNNHTKVAEPSGNADAALVALGFTDTLGD